jgi:hypothetical protein
MIFLFAYTFFAYIGLIIYSLYYPIIHAYFSNVINYLIKPFRIYDNFISKSVDDTIRTENNTETNITISKYFNGDRMLKYGYGLIRMGLIILFLELNSGFFNLERFYIYIYLGFIGAIVNVSVFSFNLNMILLAIGCILCIRHVYFTDYIILFSKNIYR